MRLRKIFILSLILLYNYFIFSSGLETKGIGARGRGMGYAMVSVEGDWGAIYYNPALIAFFEANNFGCEYEFFTGIIESTHSLRNLNVYDADQSKGDFVDFIGDEPLSFNKKTIDSDVHYMALGYIYNLKNYSFGVGMYGSGSGTMWKDSIQNYYLDTITGKISFTNGALNIPFVIAYKFNNNLSIGLTLGLNLGILDVEYSKVRRGVIDYDFKTIQDTQGFGISKDIGVFYKVNDELNLGFVCKFPYTYKKEGTTEINQSLLSLELESDTIIEMDYPLRLVFGISYNLNDKHLIALSINWLNWSDYIQDTDYKNDILGIFEDNSGNIYNWQDCFVINAGYEMNLDEVWTLRCGVTYDEAPEEKEYRTLIGGQVIDVWLFSIGGGYNKENYSIDFGYIYTYGPKTDGFIPGAKYEMNLHEFFIGFNKKFDV